MEINKFMNVVSIYIDKEIGFKQNVKKQNKELWWKRRIEGDIRMFRKDINILEREKRGELRKREKFIQFEKKYNIGRKKIIIVIEELKQRVFVKVVKIKRYG